MVSDLNRVDTHCFDGHDLLYVWRRKLNVGVCGDIVEIAIFSVMQYLAQFAGLFMQ